MVKRSYPNIDSSDLAIITEIDGEKAELSFVGKKLVLKVDIKHVEIIDPSSYGDAFEEKICNICHRILDVTEFDLNQNGKNNRPVRRPSCKKCREGIDGKGMTASQKNYWKKFKPINEKFECPICEKTTIAQVTSKVVLNHDHETGEPSGWICDSCNTGLGRFKDDPKILQRAIKYLEDAKKAQGSIEM